MSEREQELQSLVLALADRVSAQSELLSKRAELTHTKGKTMTLSGTWQEQWTQIGISIDLGQTTLAEVYEIATQVIKQAIAEPNEEIEEKMLDLETMIDLKEKELAQALSDVETLERKMELYISDLRKLKSALGKGARS